MSELARPVPKDIPGLWDLHGPQGEFFCDVTTGQVLSIAQQHGWLLPEPSHADRADLMDEADHRPEDFC